MARLYCIFKTMATDGLAMQAAMLMFILIGKKKFSASYFFLNGIHVKLTTDGLNLSEVGWFIYASKN